MKKDAREIPDVAASGTATVLIPGMNLAMTRERLPCLEMKFELRRTQESGSSDIRQSVFSTAAPRHLPIAYQAASPIRHATTARSSALGKLSCPIAESTPAATSIGTAGTGAPNCSAATQANSNAYPCFAR